MREETGRPRAFAVRADGLPQALSTCSVCREGMSAPRKEKIIMGRTREALKISVRLSDSDGDQELWEKLQREVCEVVAKEEYRGILILGDPVLSVEVMDRP
ncbi:hypothetical protein [Microbispora sp. NPDC049125]|uniref:hypothetical protein n=1 Tax=Microbispora sp. NPDC049125 TaxID=3154929 RepID=UPI0034677BF9